VADDPDLDKAKALVESGITWDEVWAGVQAAALEKGEWAGYPQLVEEHRLVLEPRWPHQEMAGVSLRDLRAAPRVCTDADVREDLLVRNEWYSAARRAQVTLYQEGGGRVRALVVPAEPAAERLALALGTLDATTVWARKAELAALGKLADLVKDHIWWMYLMTGSFPERSPRSGVTYFFRRLRPTVALRPTPDGKRMLALAALCLHPIGFYHGTHAGVMAPTDDVLAHLLMVRGDEHKFWRMANQHPIEAGVAGV
jgi:hypothetical protein